MEKVCNACSVEKNITEFYKCKKGKLGVASKCKVCENERVKKWKYANLEKLNEYARKYRKNNPEKVKESDKKYKKHKRSNDPLYKLNSNVRTMICKYLKKKGFKKNTKTLNIIGCTFEEFKKHIESKFEPWMSWDNYGNYNGEFNFGFDIDHIVPLSTAKTEEDILKLNHYTNLQPLCSKVNRDIKKGNKKVVVNT